MDKYLVFDVETANCPKDEKGQLDTQNAQVYDLGMRVIDKYGNVYAEKSLVNKDVFFGMRDAMKEAYFADKIPQYMRDIWNHEREVVDTWGMWRTFRDMCRDWNVKAVIAHNAHFDVTALNATMRYQTKSFKRFFLPYGVQVWDTMKMANDTICKQNGYISFCKQNGYMTKHKIPQVRKTAEVLWRYLSGDDTFEESHTGLEDVAIEAEIFVACARQHKAMERMAEIPETEIELVTIS